MKIAASMRKYIIFGSVCLVVIVIIAASLIFTATNNGQRPAAESGHDSVSTAADVEENPAGVSETNDGGEQGAGGQPDAERSGVTRINVYSTDRDLDRIIKLYAEKHWDFDYTINFYTDATTYSAADIVSLASEALISQDGSLDMYCLPAAVAPKFIKGEYSGFACTYKERGIDVDALQKEAEIPECIIGDGSNPDGELIALPYTAEAALFMYRRPIAKKVFGTDDPDTIASIIGSGTQKWDKFIEAAQALKKQGYYIVPGYGDLEYMVDTPVMPFAVPAESLEPYPGWLEFMDVSKYLIDNDLIKHTKPWTDEWFDDIYGKSDNVFGFVTYTDMFKFLGIDGSAGDWAVCIPPFNTRVPAYTGILVSKDSPNKDLLGPLVEWITLDSSEGGFQYSLANGTSGLSYNNEKLSVISGTVMKKVDRSDSILGGQNINPLVCEALRESKGLHINNFYQTESDTYSIWQDVMAKYIEGEKDRDSAIADFYNKVR